jgi:hypothetical protein
MEYSQIAWVGMTGPVILGRAGRTPLPLVAIEYPSQFRRVGFGAESAAEQL